MKQNIKLTKMVDKNTYEDSRGRKIYVDKKTNRVYVIPKNLEGRHSVCQLYLILGITIALLVGFLINWYVSIPAGLVSGLALYLYFKFGHIKNLEEVNAKIESFPEKLPSYVVDAQSGKGSMRFRLGLSIIFPAVLVLNIMQQIQLHQGVIDENIIILLVASGLMLVYDIYILIRSAYALRYIKENEK